MTFRKRHLALPSLYFAGGLVNLYFFLKAPPDGLANIAIILYVLPFTLLGKLLDQNFPPFGAARLGYYAGHVGFYLPSLLLMTFFFYWLSKTIFKARP